MRPQHPLQLQSVLLARTRPSLAIKYTAPQRIHSIRPAGPPSFSIRLYNTNDGLKSMPLHFQIRSGSKSTTVSFSFRRQTSTISSNPPPPSTSDRARRAQTYTPPPPSPSSTANSNEASIPDPTTSYSAPITTLTPPLLTWNAFLALRRSRRHYNVFASMVTSLLTTSAAIPLLSQQSLESMTIFNLDPFIVLGISTFSFAALGWLLGPTVGNAVFNFVHRARRREMDAKERDFFARIKKNRVDATGSSAGNPVPDYYGEKIGSVAGYRTWLRDQRAFNRRKQRFL